MAASLESLADSVNVISQEIAKLREEQLDIQQNVQSLRIKTETSEVSASSSGQFGGPSGAVPGETAADGQPTRVPGEQRAETVSAHSINRPTDALSPIHDVEVNAAEIQRDCEVIKDSLQRVRLPNSVRVFDSKSGIKKECQATLAVVSKCACYSETAIKQLLVLLNESTSGRPVSSDHAITDIVHNFTGRDMLLAE